MELEERQQQEVAKQRSIQHHSPSRSLVFSSTPIRRHLNQQQQLNNRFTDDNDNVRWQQEAAILERVSIKFRQDIWCEVENEPLSFMEATTLTSDKHCSFAMSIRYSQVTIQNIRDEANRMLEEINDFIDELPLKHEEVCEHHREFIKFASKLEQSILSKTSHQMNSKSYTAIQATSQNHNPVVVSFSTPRKSKSVNQTLRPLDRLALQIKSLCNNYIKQLYEILNNSSSLIVNNGYLESEMRTLLELYEKFISILIGAECLNIFEILYYSNLDMIDKTANNLNLQIPIKPFVSSYQQLPMKWALIALWQLTKEDEEICKILIESQLPVTVVNKLATSTQPPPSVQRKVARRLDFDVPSDQEFTKKFITAIGLLVNIIIKQPNKHERVDMMRFIKEEAMNNRLVDLEDRQHVSLAIYTTNQYKIAALRILNHLCINEDAIKTILKALKTYDYDDENEVIKSIFNSYKIVQEHMYQNSSKVETTIKSQMVHSDKGKESDQEDAVVEEALKLLVQLMNSFHCSNSNSDYYNAIGQTSIEILVYYLTNIIKSTKSGGMLFLAMNVLANISFVSTKPFKLCETIKTILHAFNLDHSRMKDLLLRDQVVTILANLATKHLDDLITNGGLVFLLSCLENCPLKMANYRLRYEEEFVFSNVTTRMLNIDECNRNYMKQSLELINGSQVIDECNCDGLIDNDQRSCELSAIESDAIERIYQKVAITFARMSIVEDRCTIKMILKYGGIKQLIGLCKFSQRRQDSQIVLVACVTALKRMALILDENVFRYYNALDLIELDTKQLLQIYALKSEQ